MFYLDTIAFTPHHLEALVGLFGPEKTLSGTDYPCDMADYDLIEHSMTAKLSADGRAAICGGNARDLFGFCLLRPRPLAERPHGMARPGRYPPARSRKSEKEDPLCAYATAPALRRASTSPGSIPSHDRSTSLVCCPSAGDVSSRGGLPSTRTGHAGILKSPCVG